MTAVERFETFQGKDGQWYSRLVGRNNEIIMSSEGHPDERGAQRNIEAATSAAEAILERNDD